MISLKSLLSEQSNSQVKAIQQKLDAAGYDIGPAGVDGILGKRTLAALEKYRKEKVPTAAKATDPEVLKSLTGKDINLSSQSTQGGTGTSDFTSFKQKLASKLGFNLTDEKSKFFDAWKRSENTKATNNPFATTLNYKNDPNMTKFNLANSGQGVKNFSSLDHGVAATAITLGLRYYKTLVDKLKNDKITAVQLASDSALNTWGTTSKLILSTLGAKGGSGKAYKNNIEKTKTVAHGVKRNKQSWITSDKESVYGRLAVIKPNIEKVSIWKDISDSGDINNATGEVDTSAFNLQNTWYDKDTKLTIKGIKTIKIPKFINTATGQKQNKNAGQQFTYLWVVGKWVKGWIQSNLVNTEPAKK